MTTVFLVCAVVGGTVFVCQFVMTLIGLGGEHLDFAGDVPDDVSGDFGDIGDVGHIGDVGDAGHLGDLGDAHGEVLDHGSTWLFGVISFRTIVAALTFFGLAGMAATAAGLHTAVTLIIALASGAAAMYVVHWLMRLLYGLGHDGTVHIRRSVGKRGVVYLPIPGGKSGAGKIQMRLQDRIVEYAAMTAHDEELPTGARVKVVDVISPTTLEVEPVPEHETVETGDG